MPRHFDQVTSEREYRWSLETAGTTHLRYTAAFLRHSRASLRACGAAPGQRTSMKSGHSSDYHEITVQLPSGDTYQTRSTRGSAGDTLVLDIDPSTHAAWTGGTQRLMDKGPGRRSAASMRASD